jgi:DNA repair exonuclease SbcCD ATPase subunit
MKVRTPQQFLTDAMHRAAQGLYLGGDEAAALMAEIETLREHIEELRREIIEIDDSDARLELEAIRRWVTDGMATLDCTDRPTAKAVWMMYVDLTGQARAAEARAEEQRAELNNIRDLLCVRGTERTTLEAVEELRQWYVNAYGKCAGLMKDAAANERREALAEAQRQTLSVINQQVEHARTRHQLGALDAAATVRKLSEGWAAANELTRALEARLAAAARPTPPVIMSPGSLDRLTTALEALVEGLRR